MKSFLEKYNLIEMNEEYIAHLELMHKICNDGTLEKEKRPCGSDYNCSKCPFSVYNNTEGEGCGSSDNALTFIFSYTSIQEMRDKINEIYDAFIDANGFWKVGGN